MHKRIGADTALVLREAQRPAEPVIGYEAMKANPWAAAASAYSPSLPMWRSVEPCRRQAAAFRHRS